MMIIMWMAQRHPPLWIVHTSSCPASSAWAVGTADDDANICEAAETYNVALIAIAMTTTITTITMVTIVTIVTMEAYRAEANANPVAVIRRKSTRCGQW
jgi:hypothetical protein